MGRHQSLIHRGYNCILIDLKLKWCLIGMCGDSVTSNCLLSKNVLGGLSCELEGIIESPLSTGYRNKCEFSVGYSVDGKRTVGFNLGNFRSV